MINNKSNWLRCGAVLLIAFFISACASNKSMLNRCTETADSLHPVIAVPLLLTGCIVAAVADPVVGTGRTIVGAPVGLISQAYSISPGGKTPDAFPFHGQWCGPGHPRKGENPKPIDVLDAACRDHDKCYEKFGYYSCHCDVELIRTIQESRSLPPDIAQKAGLITEYFRNSFCKGCKQFESGSGIAYVCHRPEEFGCAMKPVSRQRAYAWCP